MSVNFEQTGPISGELTFTIEQEKIQEGLNTTFNRVKKNLNVPGFRKGKVPRKMFNQMYGEEVLYEDTLNDLLPEAYYNALQEVEVEPVDQPQFQAESMEKASDWVVKAILTLRPEVKLGDYKNLEVTKQNREASLEEVEEQLKEDQENHAELVVVDREAKEGDTVVIDFLGKKDGEAFEGGAGNNYPLSLGSGSFIPGFEDQLIGAKAEDKLDINVTFPEDYMQDSLAGEDVVFEVTVHEVKERQTPELDDDFAQDLDDEVETLDELKEKRLEALKESKKAQAKDAIEDEAILKAVENAEIEEVPYAMTHEEIHRQMEIYLNNLQSQGISPDMYYQMTGTSEEDLHDQMEEGAELRVRTNLVLEQIAEEEKIEITEEDRRAEISNLAQEYNLDEETVKQALTEGMLNHDIRLKKAIELIVSSAQEVLEAEESEEEEAVDDKAE